MLRLLARVSETERLQKVKSPKCVLTYHLLSATYHLPFVSRHDVHGEDERNSLHAQFSQASPHYLAQPL